MGKSMARIDNNIVINIEWCSDNTAQTDTLIDIDDRNVSIGDTYTNGKFYDENGNEILTELENAYKDLNMCTEALALLGVELY